MYLYKVGMFLDNYDGTESLKYAIALAENENNALEYARRSYNPMKCFIKESGHIVVI